MNIHKHTKPFSNQGVALLLVIVILTAILSIGISLMLVVTGEINLSREIDLSFKALYAADQALERQFYLDRIDNIYPPSATTIIPLTTITQPDGTEACFDGEVNKNGLTNIVVRGRYNCTAGARITVQRTLESNY